MLSTIADVTNKVHQLDLCTFEFDWTRKSSDESVTYAANVQNDVAGLIEFDRNTRDLHNFMYLIEVAPMFRGTTVAGELLAFIGKDSLENGFDGFVVFESKSLLYEYYIDKYGAKPIKNRRLYFDEAATRRLIKIYLEVNYTQADILKPPMIVAEEMNINYVATPEEEKRRKAVVAEGEALIRKHGHGIVPTKNRNDLTGFRYILAIEARLGRKISEAEWDAMSIR